jgi:hypothetical protein
MALSRQILGQNPMPRMQEMAIPWFKFQTNYGGIPRTPIVMQDHEHRIKKRTRRDTPLMLGGRADRYLHTPARERRACS